MTRASRESESAAPSRRMVLRATAGAGGLLALGACGVRLEDDAPQVPLIPGRTPIPAEAALLAYLTALRSLRDLAGQVTSALADEARAVHSEQLTIWRAALIRAGVTTQEVQAATGPLGSATASVQPSLTPLFPEATPSPTTPGPHPPPAPTASASVPPELEALADAERTIVADHAREISRCGAGLYPLVVSALASHSALVGAMSGAPDLALVQPTAAWTAPEGAIPLLEATYSATYALEVAAPRLHNGAAAATRAAVGSLRVIAAQQSTRGGPSAPAPALSYPLVSVPGDDDGALRLTVSTLTSLGQAYAASLPALAGAAWPVAMDTARWLGEIARLSRIFGQPVPAFPGLQ